MSRPGRTEGTSATDGPSPPQGFEDLAPWLDWALEPERARTAKKVASSMKELRAFYDAVLPQLEEMIRHLEDFRDGDMPAPARNLYLISLSLVESEHPVKLYRHREGIEACDPPNFNPQQ